MAVKFNPFTGNLDLIDTTAAAGSTTQIQYNNAGLLAGVSTMTFDGTSVTLAGRLINSYSGTASSPAKVFTGAWFTGGTSTTTKPQLLIEPSGATSTGWSTSGTGLGINAASGFTGRLLDLQLNGTSNFSVDSSGRASVPLGTAALPSIYPGTDTNTGIYSPGADTLAVSTNGGERLRVASDGKVGLGTSVPSAGIHVKRASSGGQAILDNTGEDYTALDYYNNGSKKAAVQWRDSVNTLRIDTFGAGSEIAFRTVDTERMRIDSSGRLLVGTSGSSRTLPTVSTPHVQIQGTDIASSTVLVTNTSNDAEPSVVALNKSRGSSTVQINDELGRLSFFGFSGQDEEESARISTFVDTFPSAPDDMPGRLVFSTSANASSTPTERMRIGNNGVVYFGTTESPAFGGPYGTSIRDAGSIGLFKTYRDVDGSNVVAGFGGTVGQAVVYGDGDLANTNNSYGAISDIKLKENIVDASSQWDDLKALQVRKYNFKAETGYSTHTQIGLVAQEVELVSPGLVGESIDENTGESTKSVNYSVLYMKAVKALQEAMERIETLEAKVAALEGN